MGRLLVAFSIIVLSTSLARAQAPSDDSSTKFQAGSEEAIEETTETKDGKTIHRVRRGKVSGRKGEMRVGEIEEGDVDVVSRRQKSLNLTTFGFGPFGSSTVGEKKMLYGFTYGKRWEVSTTGEIAAEVLGVLNDKGSLWNGSLGFNFLPSTSDFSPIFGGAFGFGYADVNEGGTSAGGFSGQLNAGVRMFRLSETQMEVMASYTAVFTEGTPGVAGVQLRVLF